MRAHDAPEYSVVQLPDGRLGMFAPLTRSSPDKSVLLADGSMVLVDEDTRLRLVAQPGEVIRATLPFLEAVLHWYAEADPDGVAFYDEEEKDTYERLFRAVDQFVRFRTKLGWHPDGRAAELGITTYPRMTAPDILLLQTRITELLTEGVSGPPGTRFRTDDGYTRWSKVAHAINKEIMSTLLEGAMPDLEELSDGIKTN